MYADCIYCIWICIQVLFKFYSNEHRPVHIHVLKDGHEAKYEVSDEIVQMFNHGFKKHEISIIESVIEENKENIEKTWNECFPKE